MSTKSKLLRVAVLAVVLFIVIPQSAQAARRRRVFRIAYSSSPVVARYLRFNPFAVIPRSALLRRVGRLDMPASADRGEIGVPEVGATMVLGVRPPIRIPYRPPLRSPYRPPMPW